MSVHDLRLARQLAYYVAARIRAPTTRRCPGSTPAPTTTRWSMRCGVARYCSLAAAQAVDDALVAAQQERAPLGQVRR
jgi:hypothetical protein